MKYENLNDKNKIGEKDLDDGYFGKITHVTIHKVNNEIWYKAPCGCFIGKVNK